MRLFHLLWLFILWLKMEKSLQREEVLCDKPAIRDADIIHNEKESYHHREQVRFECKKDGNKRFAVSCKQGNWTEIQSCAECPKPDVPNGFVNVRKNNYMLSFTCNPGYKLYTKGWWGEVECLGSKWSGLESVQCIEETKCGEIPAIPNAEMNLQHRAYEQNEIIPIICKKGYQAQVDHLNCQKGNWTLNGTSFEDVCTPSGNPCGHPPRIEDAVVETSYQQKFLSGSVVTYQCRAEYTMDGGNTGTLECFNGEWENKSITCSQNCTVTGVPQNVRITTNVQNIQARRGQKLSFACRYQGHFLRGNAVVECLADGQWSAPFPTCGGPVGCDNPPLLTDGDTKESLRFHYSHNERVEYICQNLYQMEGQPYQTCVNGEWFGKMRCIRPCTVDAEAMSRHNIAFKYRRDEKQYAPHNDEIEFRCISGIRRGRLSMRQRCTDGVMHLPTCY